jgi:hypothetical protein
MKAILVMVCSLFCFEVMMAQEAKLNTTLKSQLVPEKPKVKVIGDAQPTTYDQHKNHLTWVFNSKVSIKSTNPIIINYSNVEDLKIDKASRSLVIKYKIEKPEIISLYVLARKYCKLNGNDVLFSVDDEWQKQPDSTFIAIDAIKYARVVDSKNYPNLSKNKDRFVVMAIKTVNPPKKEDDNDGKPKIYIR